MEKPKLRWKADVKVNKIKSLRIYMEHDENNNQGNEDRLPLHYKDYDPEVLLTHHNPVWFVNGVMNKNSTRGTIRPAGKSNAEFTAPAKVPDRNPVTVSVQPVNLNITGKNIGNARLSSGLLIYDDLYLVTIDSHVRLRPAGSDLGEVSAADFGLFMVELKKNQAKVQKIYNHDGVLNYTQGRCTYKITQPGIGIVHIPGIRNIKITPADPPTKPYAKVEIDFESTQMVFPVFEIRCPDGTFPNGGSFFSSAHPIYFSFWAKDETRKVYEVGKFEGDHWVKITVGKATNL